ncbi:MAG TPA: ABC transporter ATP-binding protein [Fibrobacteres bacterium]|jgi:iron complex transport system ATP-binding protein|nr:ABC transporter ATP-binding protein [Fibrobacterota bacterium]
MITKLAVKNLCFGYHIAGILKNLHLEVGDGQIVSIVGPNGSGKSTLIKCIDRILVPSSGNIIVDRRDLAKMSRLNMARMIAYVPQNSPRIFPNTVFDVVMMGRRPHLCWNGSHRDEEKVWEALRILNIENLALNPFNELSGGQQQKVLISRALAQETGVILLDEPTSSLDLWHQIDVMEVLQSLVKKRNIAAVIAIHDLNAAARYSNRIIMMNKGKIVANGKPDAVINEENLKTVYAIKANVRITDEIPYVIPLSRIVRSSA